MALGNTNNILAGIPDVAGGLWFADPVAKDAYPTAISELEGAFTAVGFVGEEGVAETNERATEKRRAWGGDVVRVLQTEHNQTFSFALIESSNIEVLKLIYGDENVTQVGDEIEILQNSKVLPKKSFVLEMLDGDTKIRKFIPDGQIVETGEVTWVHSDIVQHQVTIEAFADEDGVKVYTWYSDVSATE